MYSVVLYEMIIVLFCLVLSVLINLFKEGLLFIIKIGIFSVREVNWCFVLVSKKGMEFFSVYWVWVMLYSVLLK